MTPRSILSSALRQTLLLDSPFSRRSALARIGLAAVTVLVTAGSASAASQTWTTGGSTASWGDPTNWGGNTAPGNTTSGITAPADTATFNSAVGTFGTPGTPITIDSGRTVNSIAFGSSAGAFTIGTAGVSPLFLSTGGSISNVAGTTASENINAPLVLGIGSGAVAYSFTSNSSTAAATLNFGGQISNGSAAAATLTLNGTNTGTNTIGGNIVNGSGPLAVTINSSGAWALSGANTYTGATTLTAGTLDINSSSAIGTGTLAIASGAAINNTSGNPVTLSTNNAVTFTIFTFGGTNNLNLGTGGATDSSNTSTVTLNGTNSNLTLGGILTNSGSGTNEGFTVNGAGNTLTLGGFTSTNKSGNKIWAIGGSGNLNVTGAIGNGTTTTGVTVNYGTGVTAAASGTLTLSGTNTYSGGTSLGGNGTPTLNINSSTALGTGTLAISGGVSTINNTSGSSITLSNNNVQTWNMGFTFTGTNNLNMGTGSVTMSNSPTLTVSGGTLTVGGAISGSSSSLNKKGAGTLVLSGANTYVGGMLINTNGGTVQFTQTTAMPNTGAVTVNSGGVLAVNAGGTGEWTNATSGNGSIGGLFSGLGGQSGSTVTLNSGSAIGIDTTNAGGSLTYSGNITNAGVGLVKLGTGTLALGGANTYTGATTVSAGTLYISGSTGASSAVSVASGAALGGTGTAGGAVTINGGGAINLVDGSIGSLKVGSLTLGTGSTALSFDIGAGATNNLDSITDLGALTTNGTSNITIGFVSGSPTLTTGTYTLISGAINSTQFGTFSLADPTLGAYSLSLFNGGASGLELVVNTTSAGANTYYYTGTTGTDFTDFHNYNTTASGGTQQTAGLSSTSDVFIGATSPAPANIAPTVGTNSVTINSLTFAPSGAGGSLNGTGTVTIMGTSDGTVTNGVADSAGGSGTETLAAPVALGADQSWSVSGASDTLADTGGIHGAHKLTLSGNGTFNFANGNSDYSGGTAVSSGAKLLITNTTGTSALGTGALTVAQGASFGGNGTAQGLASFALGSGGSGTTQVQVGSGGTDTTSKLTLGASGASTINNANLTFNLSTATPGQANVLALGATPMSFLNGNTTLTLNLVGNNIIAPDTAYVLITDSNGFQGLTTSGPNNIITGGLSIAGTSFFGASAGNNGLTTGFYNGSYLFLADGGTEIEVEVVPEPSTWAMIIGGLGVLVFWQRRRRSC